MKSVAVISMLLVQGAHGLSAEHKAVGVSFGPQNCVSLTRSSAGSCVISTGCEGIDTSSTEFAFDCIGQTGKGDIVRHSFGVGGFEDNEEFDTEVKCGRCATVDHKHRQPATKVKKVEAILKPAPVLVLPKSETAPQETPAPMAHDVTAAPEKTHEEVSPGAVVLNAKATTGAKAEAQASWNPFSSGAKAETGSSEVVKYGPASCVSVWRSEAGHCVMSTKCNKEDIANYEFGLVCVDKAGSPVKHLFGKDSFDPKETFDTLIKCDECLGLEDIPDTVALAGEVASMAKEVKSIKDVMQNISINVNMLNKAVFPPQESAPGPAPAAAAPAPAAAPTKFLVHGAAHHRHHHGNLRHQHHRHHRRHRREESDDDEEREDDYDRRDDDERENVQEGPQVEPVQELNMAALKLQQAEADRQAEVAQTRQAPMNSLSEHTNEPIPGPRKVQESRGADDDSDGDDDEDGED